MSEPVTAQTRMKALVMSRLLMGDISSWDAFEQERKIANQITNRRTARSVSSQIGRGYRELTKEVWSFINKNFIHCEYVDLARLCDTITIGTGMSLRLDEFEENFFPLSEAVKRRTPSYAHVHISTYGLQFEFPEHHFLRDIETSLPELLDARSQLSRFGGSNFDAKRDRKLVAGLVAKENFLSRSTISAAFSLVEAYLSGLFFTAVHSGSLGCLTCTEDFRAYAKTKESASLRDRIDRVVRFASNSAVTGNDKPFQDFIEVGKRYRDAIHHTTPFQRRDIKPGGRLTALYEIDGNVALRCVHLACGTILQISGWINSMSPDTDITVRCGELKRNVAALLPDSVIGL